MSRRWPAAGLRGCRRRWTGGLLTGRQRASGQDNAGKQEPDDPAATARSHGQNTAPGPPRFPGAKRPGALRLVDIFFAGVFVGLRDFDVVLGRFDRMHPVEFLGGLLPVLFGFFDVGAPG